jgi:subtilisin family serine protease
MRPVLVLALSALSLAAPAAAGAATPIPGQYIVVLKNGQSGRQVAADHARSAHARVLQTYDAALHGYAAKLSDADLAKVKADGRVAYVSQDVQGTPAFTQTLPTGVNRIDADQSPTAQLAGNGTGTVNGDVAIYDTGIQVNHPDLNVAGGVNCLDSTDTYNDHTYGDQYGHGTHVAGIVGAKDDGNGVVGVVPGVRLWSVRVLNSAASGTASSQLCGINWVTANGPSLGIKVVNASMALFGRAEDGNCGYTAGDVLHQAICRSSAAGITWVFAAGNSTTSVSNLAGGGYNEVLTVTASADSNGQPNVGSTASFSCGSAIGSSGKKNATNTATDDKYAPFSDWAATAAQQAHTVAAPGECIWSTFLNSSYGYLTGTSMSSPHAAGVVELCLLSGQCTGTTPQVIQKIVSDAAGYNGANPSYGFTGDPLHAPVSGRYYGYQLRAGIY